MSSIANRYGVLFIYKKKLFIYCTESEFESVIHAGLRLFIASSSLYNRLQYNSKHRSGIIIGEFLFMVYNSKLAESESMCSLI